MNLKDRRPFDDQLFQDLTEPVERFNPYEMNELQLPPPIRALLALYQAEIEYTDHAVGQVMAALEEEDLRSNTILILTADHGENLIDHKEFHAFFRHGDLTHETEVHVPFIVSCPGILPQSRHVKEPSSQIDILPTISDLLDLDDPEKIDGISLLERIYINKNEHDRMIFSEATQPIIDLVRDASRMIWVNDRNSASVRWGDRKYITIPYRQYEAIFEIEKDPREENNLFVELRNNRSELVTQFRESLESWRAKATAGNIDTDFELSEEDREKLEGLGYVQD